MISEQSTNISAKDLVEILFRRRFILLASFGGVMLLTILITLFTPKVYESEMKILVQNTRENVVISTERVGPTQMLQDVTEQQINSELEILNSHDVLDSVADPGWNNNTAAQRTPAEIKAHDKRIEKFESKLGAEPGRKSNVITVTFDDRSPVDAQQTLRNLAASYLQVQRGLQRPAGASDFFAGEEQRYRTAWNEATQRFVDFQQQHQVVSLPDQETSLQKDVLDAQNQLRTIDVGLTEYSGRLASNDTQMHQVNQRQVTTAKTVPYQESVQQLNTLMVTLENKRTSLLTMYKPDDRMVKEVETQLAQTRKALDQALTGSAQETSTDINPSWQALRDSKFKDEMTRSALVNQRATVVQQLASMQQKLGDVEALTMQFNMLKSSADQLKDNYALYVQKHEQAQIEDAMDARKLLNVTIAEQPTLSYMPVKPKPLTNLLLGFVTACFLAALLVYLAELGRRTIQSPYELDAAISMPLLATVQRFGTPEMMEHVHDDERLHYVDVSSSPTLLGSPAEQEEMV
jgi:uncharacterized protein involved in exopolysaccharide biosynthesis